MTTTSAPSKRFTSSNLSRRIAIGVVAGFATGLFFGEYTAILQSVADGYIRLLQMTVLPYVTVSIISGLGSLDLKTARTLGKRVGAVLVLLWAAALVAALLVALTFPKHQSASFFSTTLLQDREGFDFLGLYIPTNPFNSLANNIVPAVVLFSLAVGLALIKVPQKARLIEVLNVANQAIANATNFVVSLTPYGVFAIAAVVSGTLGFETLERLEVYLVSYIGIALLLSMWILPGLVAALTPVPFRAMMSRTRDALILAFMTTSLFAVLPLLTEAVKELLREYAPEANQQDDTLPEVIVPVSFNFPHAGKLMAISFVLFAAWFSDTDVPFGGYVRLMGTGLVVLFGNVNAAIPFLLDLLHIPADTFRLFVTSGIINARFGTLVAAVHTTTIALLGTCAVTGALRINTRKLMRFGVISLALIVLVVGGLRELLRFQFQTPYDKDQVIANMEAIHDRSSDTRVFKPGEQPPPLPAASALVSRMRQRGIVRVGYFDDSLPYAFFNGRGELVGLDVEMAQQLGRDLGVGVEFVPVGRGIFETGLDPAVCDVIMSGAVIAADRALRVQFSQPYLDETIALIVRDDRAPDFADWGHVREMGPLRIGVPQSPLLERKVHEELSDAEIVPIADMADIFKPYDPPIDAFIAPAERGSAYTILHPEFSVVVPKPRIVKIPLAYVVAGRDREMTDLLNTWIDLKKKDGTIDQLYSHWVLGEETSMKTHRWSIVRNVLHLVR
jgi:Na+/H+-dicarboxylate symporter/ABC-type amino acid transport substrate-binding protein